MKISSINFLFCFNLCEYMSPCKKEVSDSHLHQLKPVSSACRYIKQSIECSIFEKVERKNEIRVKIWMIKQRG